jgi:hypothetical protein
MIKAFELLKLENKDEKSIIRVGALIIKSTSSILII